MSRKSTHNWIRDTSGHNSDLKGLACRVIFLHNITCHFYRKGGNWDYACLLIALPITFCFSQWSLAGFTKMRIVSYGCICWLWIDLSAAMHPSGSFIICIYYFPKMQSTRISTERIKWPSLTCVLRLSTGRNQKSQIKIIEPWNCLVVH